MARLYNTYENTNFSFNGFGMCNATENDAVKKESLS